MRSTDSQLGRPGGDLVVALRSEPKTFNPVFAGDISTLTIVHRLTGDLIHIDRQTHRTTPALAKSWSVSEDGRQFTLELQRGVRFSDGHPFDADDVLFTFEVFLDEKLAAPHRALLIVGGEPIQVEKLEAHTLRFTLKEPYAVGERLFDSIPILPRHRLEPAFREGRLHEAW
ncbi:MAG: ABC transporter substrate-binding protein, partial [Acidobacteriota bacterium]